jgi:hypothetical protein
MSCTYNKEHCKFCSAVNWIYLGDLTDLTGVDYRGFKCHNCKKDQDWDDDFGLTEEDLDGLEYADGKPTAE